MFTGAAELPVHVRLDSRAENLPIAMWYQVSHGQVRSSEPQKAYEAASTGRRLCAVRLGRRWGEGDLVHVAGGAKFKTIVIWR